MALKRVAGHKKGARDQGATIVFVDESGFSLTPNLPRTWSRKGVTPIVSDWYAREKLNAVCALECRWDGSDPNVLFYMQPESIKSRDIIRFLDALHQQIPGPIVLLWDGYSSHKSKLVTKHVDDQAHWLTVEKLPAYAPELNPVEYLFSALKSKDIGGYCAEHVAQISDRLECAADRIAQNEGIMQGFLKASGLFDELRPAK